MSKYLTKLMYFVMLPLDRFHAFSIFLIIFGPFICTPSLAPHAPLLMHSYIHTYTHTHARTHTHIHFFPTPNNCHSLRPVNLSSRDTFTKHADKMYFIISKPAKLREQVFYRVGVCVCVHVCVCECV